MNESTPAQVLIQEHRIIQRVVAAMAVIADELREGRRVDPQDLRDMLTFLRVFADECHHGKEEQYLFPLLEARGVPATGCPVGVLKNEHVKGRTLVAQFAEAIETYAGDGSAGRDALIAALAGLVELYPNHIWKEDYLLLPMADKVLSAADQKTLAEQFERVEAQMGQGTHEKFEQLAQRLENRANSA
ncbi:MAG TPA: hemerythrin domain-containing protein [Bryobacteraceae bacterium]|nr:hemerythrin domain-containing protein [Bryobacteraceae bacterium]